MHRKAAPLVRAAIGGDKDALGDLCILFKPIFAGYIYRYLSKRHLPMSMSEDLLQDTYVAVCKSFPYYDPSSENIIPLMKTIVRRVCAAEADRKANRLRTVPMSNIDGTDEDSEDSEWTVTDAMVVSAWMSENSSGYTEGPSLRRKRRPRNALGCIRRLPNRRRRVVPVCQRRNCSGGRRSGRNGRHGSFVRRSSFRFDL